MEESFDTYGQVSPLSQKFNFDNTEEKRLDNFSMGQTLGYFDEQRAVLEKKRNEIQGLAKVIDSSYQQWKNTSFLSPQAKERAKQSYMNNVKALEEHHSIPRDQRGVEWFAQFENLKNNVNSEDINNDLRNRALYQEVNELRTKGIVSEIEFSKWFDDFKANASDGKDYEKTSTMFRNGRPATAHESLFSVANTMISTSQFAPQDYNYDAIGNIAGIKEEKWNQFMDDQFIPSAIQDGLTRFKNLPDDMQQKYMNGQDDIEGTKRYMKDLFRNYRFAHNTHNVDTNANAKKYGDGVDVYRDYYQDALDSAGMTSEAIVDANGEVIQEAKTANDVAIPFNAPVATQLLRKNRENVEIPNFEFPINIEEPDANTGNKIPKKYIVRLKSFKVSDRDNYDFIDKPGTTNTKMSAYKEKNKDGSTETYMRMHDQTMQFNEANIKNIIEKNIMKDSDNIVLVDEKGIEVPLSKTKHKNGAGLLKILPSNYTETFFNTGKHSMYDTGFGEEEAFLPGSRTYVIRGGIIDRIPRTGLSPQALNREYAKLTGINYIGGSVSNDASNLFTTNNDNAYNTTIRR